MSNPQNCSEWVFWVLWVNTGLSEGNLTLLFQNSNYAQLTTNQSVGFDLSVYRTTCAKFLGEGDGDEQRRSVQQVVLVVSTSNTALASSISKMYDM